MLIHQGAEIRMIAKPYSFPGFGLALALGLLSPSLSSAQDCDSTQQCAAIVLDAEEELTVADLEIQTELAEVAESADLLLVDVVAGDAAALSAAGTFMTDSMYRLGRGQESIPTWGNRTTPLCPPDYYAVGFNVNVATGQNAGMLYTDLHPICRRISR